MMARFKIPKKFTLAGNEIEIIQEKDIKTNDAIGLWKSIDNKIYIRTEFESKKIPQDVLKQTFCHELTHAILDTMGEENLSSNEKFVDLFGQFLYQFLKSSE